MLRCKPFVALCFIFLLLAGCSSHYVSSGNISSEPKDTDETSEVREGHSTILFMTDLEIIKRATDHLKKRGEKVAFDETEISVHHSEKVELIFYDVSGKAVIHKGDYMRIVLYPPKNHQTMNITNVFRYTWTKTAKPSDIPVRQFRKINHFKCRYNIFTT